MSSGRRVGWKVSILVCLRAPPLSLSPFRVSFISSLPFLCHIISDFRLTRNGSTDNFQLVVCLWQNSCSSLSSLWCPEIHNGGHDLLCPRGEGDLRRPRRRGGEAALPCYAPRIKTFREIILLTAIMLGGQDSRVAGSSAASASATCVFRAA